MGLSLLEFAKRNPTKKGPSCWMCSIPERAEIEAAIKAGKVTQVQAANWHVRDKSYPRREATVSRIQHHMQSHVEP